MGSRPPVVTLVMGWSAGYSVWGRVGVGAVTTQRGRARQQLHVVPVEVSDLRSSVWKRTKLAGGWGVGVGGFWVRVRNEGGIVVMRGWRWKVRRIAQCLPVFVAAVVTGGLGCVAESRRNALAHYCLLVGPYRFGISSYASS